jgi:hypothetical protein
MKKLLGLALLACTLAGNAAFAAQKTYSFYLVSEDGRPANKKFIKTKSGVPVEFAGTLSKDGKALFTIVRVASQHGKQVICFKNVCKGGSSHPSKAIAVKF